MFTTPRNFHSGTAHTLRKNPTINRIIVGSELLKLTTFIARL
jgi:hypothetical protein